MQLVIGGFGFVGSNTVEALLDLNETCVIVQHKKDRMVRVRTCGTIE